MDDGSCEPRVSFSYLNTSGCGSIRGAINDGSIHPQVAYNACLQSFGCRWRNADDTVELPFDGAEPAGPTCALTAGRYRLTPESAGRRRCDAQARDVVVPEGAIDIEALVLPSGCPDGCDCFVGRSSTLFPTSPSDPVHPDQLTCQAGVEVQCFGQMSSGLERYTVQGTGDRFRIYGESVGQRGGDWACIFTASRL